MKNKSWYALVFSSQKLIVIAVIVVAFFTGVVAGYFLGIKKDGDIRTAAQIPLQGPKASPTPKAEEPFRTYTVPKIEKKGEYTVVMVGDSMTHALGPHGGTFNTFINDLYKNSNRFIMIDNYAQASTNILSLKDQMSAKTTYWDSTFEALLSREFDLILIESFGYNPLSQFSREEALQKQTQALDATMKTLMTTHPHSAIVFVATIAPNKTNYAKKTLPNLTSAERTLQAEERIANIKNHITYARSHNIPLVNVFEKSLNAQGDGDLSLINPDDFIHPSFKGVDFIGQEIANFIYDSQILPR